MGTAMQCGVNGNGQGNPRARNKTREPCMCNMAGKAVWGGEGRHKMGSGEVWEGNKGTWEEGVKVTRKGNGGGSE